MQLLILINVFAFFFYIFKYFLYSNFVYYYVVVTFAQTCVRQYFLCSKAFFLNIFLLFFVLILNVTRLSRLLTIIIFLRTKNVVLAFVSRARFIMSFVVIIITFFIFSLFLIKTLILNFLLTLYINNVAFVLLLREFRINNNKFLLIILT